jgi:hypothetical protein
VLARTRATFARETGCLLADITVSASDRGLVAQGCDRYSLCASYDGPCMPSRPPTCAEVAQERYDHCLNGAHNDGKTGDTWFVGKWGAAATVANSIIAKNQGEREASDCRQRFESESAQCTR